MKSFVLFLSLILFSCANNKESISKNYQIPRNSIHYSKFKPLQLNNYQLAEYDVNDTFQIDSLLILSAYSDGDLVTSEHPVNWGDRLVLLKNKTILYESKPVGDVYLYAPHFYQNDVNNKTIIICQLAYEYFFGGDVFLLENGNIQFLGRIEIDGPDMEISLIDIVLVSENKSDFNFHFQSDSLTFKPGEIDSLIINNNIHYSYKGQNWKFVE